MMKFKWSYFVHGAMAIIALSMGAAPGLADGSAQSESYSLTSYVMAGGGGAAASESVSGFFVIAEPVVGATGGAIPHINGIQANCLYFDNVAGARMRGGGGARGGPGVQGFVTKPVRLRAPWKSHLRKGP